MWSENGSFTDLGAGCLLLALACLVMTVPLGLLAVFLYGGSSVTPGTNLRQAPPGQSSPYDTARNERRPVGP